VANLLISFFLGDSEAGSSASKQFYLQAPLFTQIIGEKLNAVGRVLLGAFAGFVFSLVIGIPLGIILPFIGVLIGMFAGGFIAGAMAGGVGRGAIAGLLAGLLGAAVIVVLALVGATLLGGFFSLIIHGHFGSLVGLAIGVIGGILAAVGTAISLVGGIIGGALTRKRSNAYYSWYP
jgi:hypothetical protein